MGRGRGRGRAEGIKLTRGRALVTFGQKTLSNGSGLLCAPRVPDHVKQAPSRRSRVREFACSIQACRKPSKRPAYQQAVAFSATRRLGLELNRDLPEARRPESRRPQVRVLPGYHSDAVLHTPHLLDMDKQGSKNTNGNDGRRVTQGSRTLALEPTRRGYGNMQGECSAQDFPCTHQHAQSHLQ